MGPWGRYYLRILLCQNDFAWIQSGNFGLNSDIPPKIGKKQKKSKKNPKISNISPKFQVGWLFMSNSNIIKRNLGDIRLEKKQNKSKNENYRFFLKKFLADFW